MENPKKSTWRKAIPQDAELPPLPRVPKGTKRSDMTPEQRAMWRAYDKAWRALYSASMTPEEKAADREMRRVHEKRCVEKDRPRKYANNIAYRKRLFAKDPDLVRARDLAKINKNRELYRAFQRAHSKTPGRRLKMKIKGAERRAQERLAMPAWADKGAIAKIYKQALEIKNNGGDAAVDHIVPLVHSLVCGLHIATNLRIIKNSENCRKSNKLIEGLAIAPTVHNGLAV